MELQDRPRRGEGVVWRRGDDGVVVLNPNDGQYFSLDDVGGRIWELCEGNRSVTEIAGVLSREYDVEASVLVADALDFLLELKGEGLVVAD
jgi:hypothetical protein